MFTLNKNSSINHTAFVVVLCYSYLLRILLKYEMVYAVVVLIWFFFPVFFILVSFSTLFFTHLFPSAQKVLDL